MIRALIPACVSLQIQFKMGFKLGGQAAALFWSFDHILCIFEIGIAAYFLGTDVALFLSQWLRSVERDGPVGLTEEEGRIVLLLRALLAEAQPDADTRQSMSSLLLTALADQFDRVNSWGSNMIEVFS